MSAKKRKAIAIANIKKLEKGALVVRLPSNSKKITTLKQLVDGGQLKKGAEKRIKEELENTKTNTQLFNRAMLEAFKSRYQMSQVLFLYDTAAVDLKNGQHSGIFLTDSLTVDPEISLPDTSFLVVRFGYTDSSDGHKIEAMVVMDEQMEDLQPPFPYYVKMNNFKAIIGSFLQKPGRIKENANQAVMKLNGRLGSFYQRHN